jgi:hypothetical protein
MTTLIETDEPYALSPKLAAKRLGVDVSTLYRNYGRELRSGTIQSLKIGTARRIIWRSLLAHIERETRQKAGRDGSA